MNDYIIILNYLRNNPLYCFNIDDYLFPKYINSGKTNLERARLDEIKKKKSSFVVNFENCLSKEISKIFSKHTKYLSYIPEFPIPIENKELWEEILTQNGLDKTNKAWNVNYFKLDFLFPYLGYCVEIDSNFHFPNIKYDMSRDAYLFSMYGIKTLRLLNFGESKKNKDIYLNNIKTSFSDAIKSWPSKGPNKIIIDFSKTIVEEFIMNNRETFKIISNIRNNTPKFLIEKIIKIKQIDYLDITKENQDNIILSMKLIFNKELVIETA